jgi:hypothetical protein
MQALRKHYGGLERADLFSQRYQVRSFLFRRWSPEITEVSSKSLVTVWEYNSVEPTEIKTLHADFLICLFLYHEDGGSETSVVF